MLRYLSGIDPLSPSREYEKNIQHLAKAFLKLGLDHRYSVGILARNRPEWFYAHLAAIYAGGIAAGIYTTSSSDSVHHVLKLSRANLVVVEDEQQLQKVLQVRDQLPQLKAIVQMEPLTVKGVPGLYQWSDLLSMDVSDAEREFGERQAKICVNEAAVMVFTVSEILLLCSGPFLFCIIPYTSVWYNWNAQGGYAKP